MLGREDGEKEGEESDYGRKKNQTNVIKLEVYSFNFI